MEPERVFIDTNLFLRYLTNDVPEQADAVDALLRRAAQDDVRLVTSVLVLAEIVWTLERFYKLRRPLIQEKIIAILNTPGLDVEQAGLVLQAVVWYVSKNVDFIDAHNAAWMHARRLDTVYTFDQKHFARFEGLRVEVPQM